MGKGAQNQESLNSEETKYIREGEREAGREEDNIERPREWVTTEATRNSQAISISGFSCCCDRILDENNFRKLSV